MNSNYDQKIDSSETSQVELIDNISEVDEAYTDPGDLTQEYLIQTEVANQVIAEAGIGKIDMGVHINNKEEIDERTICPRCSTTINATNFGKVLCEQKDCDGYVFRKNTQLDIRQTKSILDKELEANYLNVIARVNNSLLRKQYEKAFKYSLEAEKIAPREPTTWKYYTLSEFYNTLSKLRWGKRNIDLIFKKIRENIRICNANYMEDQNVSDIKDEIATHFLRITKAQLGRHQSVAKKRPKYWSKIGRHDSIYCIKVMEKCFHLTGSVLYLKEIVDELSKPYKWVIRTISGNSLNLMSCGKNYDASGELQRIVKMVKKKDPDYIPPNIENERFV